MIKFDINSKNGFTLAEVLITLTIIGVVAAMTIPALVTKFRKEQTVVQLKKSYTEFSQAIKQSEIDNGPPDKWDFGGMEDSYTAGDSFETYWKPYLKISKICVTFVNCGYKDPVWDIVVGSNIMGVGTNTTRTLFLLQDGKIGFILASSTDEEGKRVAVKRLHIDINGAKGPNTIGLDVFAFYLSKKGLVPMGSAEGCINSSSYQCAAKIIYDGWQIKDDYPWK